MHAYLVHHGKAKSAEEDPNRGLSEEGREGKESNGTWSLVWAIVPDLLKTSATLAA
jgi:phosphohistidine phosphatase SixA